MSGAIQSLADITGFGASAFNLRLYSGAAVQPTDLVPLPPDNQILINTTDKILYCPVPGMPGVYLQHPLEGSIVANAYVISSPGVATTTSTTFQNKTTLSEVFPAGNYLILAFYQWNHDDTGNDFEGRLVLDGTPMGEVHKQEPQDSGGTFGATGTDQRYTATLARTATLSGSHDIDLEYRTSVGGAESSMFEAVIVAINLDTV